MNEELMTLLRERKCSLIVKKGDAVDAYYGRGVADLYHLLLEHPERLDGATVADKITGKGAAALMMEGGVTELHTSVISTAALSLLEGSHVSVHYQMEVPYIINRQGDGVCPVETLCKPCRTAAECREQITLFMNKNKR